MDESTRQHLSVYQHQRIAYPSDVSDEQWRHIEPLIPAERPRGRHRETDPREIVNAISYRWATGCVWRMLPHDFPAWGTVYCYFRNWLRDGTLQKLRSELLKPRPRTDPKTKTADPRRNPQSSGGIRESTPPGCDPRFDRVA